MFAIGPLHIEHEGEARHIRLETESHSGLMSFPGIMEEGVCVCVCVYRGLV